MNEIKYTDIKTVSDNTLEYCRKKVIEMLNKENDIEYNSIDDCYIVCRGGKQIKYIREEELGGMELLRRKLSPMYDDEGFNKLK